ncbi:MAG: hypothetical protein PHP85_09355 [Gallionella sp.]|nr:hypothetical protein [Gallionella sp.]
MIKTGCRMQESGYRIQDAVFKEQESGCRIQNAGAWSEQGFSESRIPNPESSQRGFSLVSAIFLLVVIAMLGTFAVTLSTTQHQSQTMDVMGARAYQAALAGVEWAAFNVSQQASGVVWPACPTPAVVVAGTVTGAGNLAPFTVTVNCSATSAVEGASTLWVYDISSVARTAGAAGDLNYVEQVATARLAK